MQLVFVPHGRRATLQIAYIAAFVGDDQGALELAGVGRVDAEVGGQLHGAAHALGHIHEGAVGEDRRIQCGKEVVAVGHHGAQVLLHQFRIIADGLGDGAENHTGFGEGLLEGGCDGNGIEYCIDGYACQLFALMQGNTQFLVGSQKFRVHFVQALGHVLLALGRGIVGNRVVVDFRVAHVCPVRLVHFKPATVGFQAPFQHPLRLFLDAGKAGDNVFIKAGFEGVGFDVCYKSVLVFPFDQLVHLGVGGRHDRRSVFSHRGLAPLVSPAASWAAGRMSSVWVLQWSLIR